MIDNDSVIKTSESVKENFDNEMYLEKIKKQLIESFKNYNTIMKYLAADAPIQILCLKPATENILLNQGFLRIYDLFNVDFIKIKGIGIARINEITTSLDKFFSMV